MKVYQLAYQLAMDVFKETEKYPIEERYSLTNQIRRSSRSIPANLAEAWKKRRYPKMFVSKVIDAAGEAGEVEVWLDFSLDCGYLIKEKYKYFIDGYNEVNKMLYGMASKSEKFASR